ncbi:antitoxin [Pasteurellaceae bacterium RH1A]|nr:antitoxin [Pasteurellaceae bacterium RH1A]
MIEASVFITNRTQAVRLPVDVRFNDDVKKVAVRVVGQERILSPINQTWDSFFLAGQGASEDFMVEREVSFQPEREDF